MTDAGRPLVDVRRLEASAVDILAEIDRAEEIRIGYSVEDGRLIERAVDLTVPTWDRAGDGEHSVAARKKWLRPIVDDGATLFGAFDGDQPVGIAVVEPAFEERLAWLAFMHVSQAYRRFGIASALWAECAQLAAAAGAESMYVSATPSGSAVGFYLSRGCELAQAPHPALFELEPDDIHLVCPLPP